MVQAYDHRASDITINEDNLFRPGQQTGLTLLEHANPDRAAMPRYWIAESGINWHSPTDWCVAFKDVTASSNVRTVIATIIPRVGAGHTLSLLFAKQGTSRSDWVKNQPLLLANLNSISLDFLARQKIHTNHLVWYLVEQMPVLPPNDYARTFGTMTAADLVRREVLHLTYTAHDMAAFARDLGHDGDPFAWDETDRRHRRARLDALFFHLYGIGRDDADYILSTFPIVEREDRAAHGRYLTRDLILGYMNALAAGDVDSIIVPGPGYE